MKKIFKVYILITLLFSSENIFSLRPNKDKSRSVSPQRQEEPRNEAIPPQRQPEILKDAVAEELLVEWKISSMSPINKEDSLLNTPEIQKYVNKNKNEIFKILFLLTLIEKINDKKFLVSNSEDMQKLLDFEKRVIENSKNLKEQFDKSEKNKKLEDFRNKGNYLGLVKEMKKMLSHLDIDSSVNSGKLSYFKKDINSQFSNLYKKYESIINEFYKKDDKKSNFAEIRNNMILVIHYNGLFSLESFLFWAIPFITTSIDKKMDSKTKHQINLRKEAFSLITNLFGIKSKITKVSRLKAASESIVNFGRNHKGKIIAAGAIATGIAASYAAEKYGAKDGKIQKYGGGLARGINYGADKAYNNSASNYVKDKTGKAYNYARTSRPGEAVAKAGNYVGGKAYNAGTTVRDYAKAGYEKVRNGLGRRNLDEDLDMQGYRESIYEDAKAFSSKSENNNNNDYLGHKNYNQNIEKEEFSKYKKFMNEKRKQEKQEEKEMMDLYKDMGI